jgi:hypothetical protein
MADEVRITKVKASAVHYLDNAEGVTRVTKVKASVVSYQVFDPAVAVTKIKASVVYYNVTEVPLVGSSGIPSEEAFGADGAISIEIRMQGVTGIPSEEAFGADGLVYQQLLDGRLSGGITSEEAFGADGLVQGSILGLLGIPSEEAFGTYGYVYQSLIGIDGDAGIPSEEAFGSGGVVTAGLIGVTGIPSEEAFGAGGSILAGILGLTGIPSEEAFGADGIITGPITGSSGIPSEEAFGLGGGVSAYIGGVKGIPSQEQFGADGQINSVNMTGLQGIPSEEAFGLSGSVVMFDRAYSNFNFYIQGQPAGDYVKVNSLNIQRQLNFHSTATFQAWSEGGIGDWAPDIGMEVIIYYFDETAGEWGRLFAGGIESFQTKKTVGDDSAVHVDYTITCVDKGKALSRRLINFQYSADGFGDLHSIMTDISDRFLLPEGLEWQKDDSFNPDMEDVEFAYVPLNEALDRIAELVGAQWQVDWYNRLFLNERPNISGSAPWAPGDGTEDVDGEVIHKDRGLYRNVELVKPASMTQPTSTGGGTGGVGFSAGIYTEDYISGTDEWIDAYPYQKYFDGSFLVHGKYHGRVKQIIDVKVNGTPVAWYVFANKDGSHNSAVSGWQFRQIEEGYMQFIGDVSNPGWSPVAPGGTLSITFEVEDSLPQIVIVDPDTQEEHNDGLENTAEIEARRAIEGGTGRYEALDELQNVTDPQTLYEYMEQTLARFSVMGREYSFHTLRHGLEIGQEMTVDRPDLGLDNFTGVIESMSIREQDKTTLHYSIKLSNKIQQRDALAAMHRLIKKLRKSSVQNTAFATFVLAQDMPPLTNPGLLVGTAVTNPFIVKGSWTLKEASILFDVPPVGADIIINIKINGVSIFPSGTYLTFPEGSSDVASTSNFRLFPMTMQDGDVVRIDVIQTGTSTLGKNGTVSLFGISV